jgi:hypothetical protein
VIGDLGRVAYEAYGKSVNWKTVSGVKMPEWDEQDPRLQEAWDAAAEAVAQKVGGEE